MVVVQWKIVMPHCPLPVQTTGLRSPMLHLTHRPALITIEIDHLHYQGLLTLLSLQVGDLWPPNSARLAYWLVTISWPVYRWPLTFVPWPVFRWPLISIPWPVFQVTFDFCSLASIDHWSLYPCQTTGDHWPLYLTIHLYTSGGP